MQLTERHIVRNNDVMKDLCNKSAMLYNFCLYHMRQVCFGKLEKFSEFELSNLLCEFKQEDFVALPAPTSQQVIKLMFKNWKAYWAAMREYKKCPSKFNGKPKIPNYIKDSKTKNKLNVVVFTNQQIRIKDNYIHFPKKTGLKPIKTKVKTADQVRIVPQSGGFIVEVVYTQQPITLPKLVPENKMSIDLGVNNLATCTTNIEHPFIIDGKELKSINQYYNKEKARLQSYISDKGTSKKLTNLTHKRNNKVENYIHQASRIIIDYCIKYKISEIVIGKNVGWKDGISIGKVNNQKFTSIPHAKFIEKIAYKAELIGIKVTVHEKSYTSKVDHLAFEEMKHHEKYLGKRVFRGLFQSSIGKLLNADVNGAIGIGRKVFGDSFVSSILDRGLAFNPVRVNVKSAFCTLNLQKSTQLKQVVQN